MHRYMLLLAARTILVASDLAPTSDAAVRAAVDLSRASGAALHAVHVAALDDLLREGGGVLDYSGDLRETLRQAGAQNGEGEIHSAAGDAALAIARIANTINADVIVLGRRRAGTAATPHRPVGPVARGVVSRSHAPCLVITEPLTLPVQNALVGIDWTETARGALFVALSWVSVMRAQGGGDDQTTLTALNVHPGTGDTRGAAVVAERTIEHELGILRRNAGAWAGVTVLGETVQGTDPAAAIANYALEHDAELVILGTRGIADGGAPLGSVSAAVTGRLSIPVLLVPPAVWRDYSKQIDYF
jgi:nucleotide-binding universal stress UspA family protein